MEQVTLLDSTLRDGAQGASISFSLQDKLRILRQLDGLGIPYIEAGNPSSNPKDREFFAKAKEIPLQHGELVAFGSTFRPGGSPEGDDGLAALLESGARTVTVFGKASAFHVGEVLRTSWEENLRMVRETIRYLVKKGRQVFFDAEHFFDGFRESPECAMAVLCAAEEAGAACLVLCDTNGGALPSEIYRVVSGVKARLSAPLGIHCHNDSGCAEANSILAVEAGAEQIQGTFLGFGERCGNANLSTLIPSLQLKMGLRCIPPEEMAHLTACARALSEAANIIPDNGLPYVGRNAFAHKGGMHIDGVLKNPSSFEHIDPAAVGNSRDVLVSEVSGRAAVAKVLGADGKGEGMAELVALVKEQELRGYQYEYASASLKLLALKQQNRFRPFFQLVYSRILGEQREGGTAGGSGSSAIVKIRVGDACEVGGGEGEGPVHALDRALRKAVGRFYPSIDSLRLIDFRVRVIDPQDATAAKVRVLVETTDGAESWSTVGVSRDIIEASLQAYMDAIEYKLWQDSQRGSVSKKLFQK